jgi:5-oxoprolinase (ATP-hydrolysing)/N-methylhydantoinase A
MSQQQPITSPHQEVFDPVTLEILWSRLIGIAEEMWTTVWRTAFSTIVAVVQDHGCELLDRSGGCLAHAPSSMPAFNLTMPNVTRKVLERFAAETIMPGDVFVTNDPWICAGHLPDICVITPIFYQGQLVGFSGTVAHAIDIGGTTDGRKAREIYEEGFRLPIMKLYDQGKPDETIFELLAANVRNPTQVIGDLEAEVTANEVGAKRVTELLAEYGLTDLQALSRIIQGRVEEAMRASIAAIPDGSYHGRV